MTRFDPGNLRDKTILITGAAGDIGRATAEACAQLGARLALLDQDREKLAKLTADLKSQAPQCVSVTCDVTRSEAVEKAVSSVNESCGPIHGLFNNAGYQGEFVPTHQYPLADFERVMAINVTGAFNVLKAVTARMVEAGGGAVVNTASMAAVGGPPNMLAYATSKAALLGMTQTAAKDLAPYNIRVNAISPAYMGPAAMWTRQVEKQASAGSQYFDTDPTVVAQQMIQSIPMRRYGGVDEIPGTVVYLLGGQSSYVTGINVPIAGGV